MRPMNPSPTIPTRIMANLFLDGTTWSIRDRGPGVFSSGSRNDAAPGKRRSNIPLHHDRSKMGCLAWTELVLPGCRLRFPRVNQPGAPRSLPATHRSLMAFSRGAEPGAARECYGLT